jgi:xylulokinase
VERTVIGIDVGTSACKVAAFTTSGELIAEASREYPLLVPGPGQVEQDPEQWWKAAAEATGAVVSAIGAHAVAGVGVSGQSWSAVMMDDEGRVLANAPIWMDTRAQDICDRTVGKLGEDVFLKTSGNRFSPSYTTPKIMWFREHRPSVYARTTHVLQSNSFIVQRLTGEWTQDSSQSYGIHAFDTLAGAYDPGLADALGLDLGLLPPVSACHEVVGVVGASGARATGLAEGTPVVAGGLDAACASLGAGVVDPGQTQEQGGQAGGMSVVTDCPVSDPRLILSRHVVPGRWLLQGGTIAGGASLRWAAETFAAGALTYRQIDQEAGTTPPGAEGLWFLPYLSGERGPIWDPKARGVFFGLGFSTSRGAIWRAVMEGVAYSVLDNIIIAEQAGAKVQTMRSVGGAASSRLWTQIKSDVMERPIEVAASTAASTLGAAVLAAVGTGSVSGFDGARQMLSAVERIHESDPKTSSVYREGFQVFRQLYHDLAPLMHRTSPIANKEGTMQ